MPPKIPSVLAIANEGGAVLIGVSDTAGAYRSVIGGPDHRLWADTAAIFAKTYVWNWHKADYFRTAAIPSAMGGFAEVTLPPNWMQSLRLL